MEQAQSYRHTPDMPEISGFGGGYEQCCQDMLEAGVKWLEENPQPDLQAQTLKNVYGIFDETSEDAKALGKVVVEAAKGEATGAQHHAVMSRLFYIAKHGWGSYCQELRKPTPEDTIQ